MKSNDDVFDKKVKEKLKKENNEVPDKINEMFDKAIDKSKVNKLKKNRRGAKITAACLVGAILVGITLPTYANDLPILRNIVDVFRDNRYENYNKYSSDLNITKESDGVKVTINKVVYDGLNLDVFYTIEGEEDIERIPDFVEGSVKINGRKTSFAGSMDIQYLEDEKVYVGNQSYAVADKTLLPKELQDKSFGGYIEMPDEFLLSIEVKRNSKSRKIGVGGKWNFDIPVTNEMVNGKVKEYETDININNNEYLVNINKLITTPINTAIQGTCDKSEWSGIEFVIFDDKGRYLEPKGGSISGTTKNDGEFINYFNMQFKQVYDDTKSLTIIPFEHIDYGRSIENEESNIENSITVDGVTITSNNTKLESEAPYKLTQDLNLDKETNLTTKSGDRYATIINIEVGNGKTKLYIKSNYNMFAIPNLIIDKNTGKTISPIDNLDYMELNTTRYNLEKNELIVEYGGELSGDNYEVQYYDYTNIINIYNEESFKIEIK